MRPVYTVALTVCLDMQLRYWRVLAEPCSVASPPRLHTLWRQMQGWLLFLPPQVSCPSVSRLCRIPDTAQKSEVRRRGREEAERKKIRRRWRRKKKLHKPRTSSICVSSRVCPAIFPLLSAYTLLCFISHAYYEIEIRVSSTLDLCSVPSLCGASWDPFSGNTRLRAGSEHQSGWWFCQDIRCTAKLYPTNLSNYLNNEATLKFNYHWTNGAKIFQNVQI